LLSKQTAQIQQQLAKVSLDGKELVKYQTRLLLYSLLQATLEENNAITWGKIGNLLVALSMNMKDLSVNTEKEEATRLLEQSELLYTNSLLLSKGKVAQNLSEKREKQLLSGLILHKSRILENIDNNSNISTNPEKFVEIVLDGTFQGMKTKKGFISLDQKQLIFESIDSLFDLLSSEEVRENKKNQSRIFEIIKNMFNEVIVRRSSQLIKDIDFALLLRDIIYAYDEDSSEEFYRTIRQIYDSLDDKKDLQELFLNNVLKAVNNKDTRMANP